MFLNQNHTVRPKIEREFLENLGNSNVFSAQKQVISKKKKNKKKRSSTKFRPKSETHSFFPPKNRWSPKIKRSLPKLRLIFRPKSEIQTLFQAESRHLLHNFGTQFPMGGAVFNFSPKIGLKSTKNVRFCILHKPMGRLEPPRPAPPSPPPQATLLTDIKKHWDLKLSLSKNLFLGVLPNYVKRFVFYCKYLLISKKKKIAP